MGSGGPIVGPYVAAACTVTSITPAVFPTQAPNPVVAGGTASYGTLTLNKSNGNCDGAWSIVTSTLPASVTATFGTPAFTGSGTTKTTTFSLVTTSATPAGTYTFKVRAGGSDTGGDVDSATGTLVVTSATVNTTTTAANATATFGAASVTLNATVAPSSVNVGTVTFTVKSGATTIGSPVTSGTVSGGSASASFPLTGVNAGSYTIQAAYSGGTGFNASNNSAQSPAPTLTINKANQTISVTTAAPASATYGATFGVAATASSGLAVAITVTGGCSGSGSGSATITMTSGTTACVVHYNQAGNTNFNAATELTSTTTAVKKTLTVTANDKSKAFGAADPTFDVAYSGFVSPDTSASLGGTLVFTFTGISGTTYGPSTTVPTAVGTYSIAPSGLSSANYNSATPTARTPSTRPTRRSA